MNKVAKKRASKFVTSQKDDNQIIYTIVTNNIGALFLASFIFVIYKNSFKIGAFI